MTIPHPKNSNEVSRHRRMWFHRQPAIITRASNNFGPGQHAKELIPTIILDALRGNPIPIFSDGSLICRILDEEIADQGSKIGDDARKPRSTIQDPQSVKSLQDLITFVNFLSQALLITPAHEPTVL